MPSFVSNNGFSPLISGNGPSQSDQQTGRRTRADQGLSAGARRADLDAPGRENRPQARGREGSHSELWIKDLENVTPGAQVRDAAQYAQHLRAEHEWVCHLFQFCSIMGD